MINTYHTSMAPPPVPPRLSGSQTLLIPAPLPSPSHSKTLIRFLVGVAVLHLLLSVGGFIYLYHYEKMERFSLAEGKAEFLSSVKQEPSHRALANLVVDRKTATTSTPGYLQWDMNNSPRKNINYSYSSWLTVLHSGDYYVYSRVTFSKSRSTSPLFSRVMLRKSETTKDEVLMQAYCNLGSPTGLCTATQGSVVTLEEGNQLGVWIENLSWVDYDEKATAFGMYRL
ncbi:CD40 ligand [Hippoglossus stenolepis]|uniref:CD40 ligand n=1 Tax=Hippoglossus stenolepis TaxID=195615 RepID=UPI001FAFD92B|nr:CD40 ligand [Hippoglossus stenolepis]